MSSDGKSAKISWRCECFADLLHRSLEQELFVFNPLTGHTHILNLMAWQLLSACAGTPRSKDYLIELMVSNSDDVEQAQLENELQEHLWQLQQLELLQPLCS